MHDCETQVNKSGERVDVMHYHYTSAGEFGGRWEMARKHYQNIMREEERINYITVLRSPRSHFLSYYYYFIQPDTQVREKRARPASVLGDTIVAPPPFAEDASL